MKITSKRFSKETIKKYTCLDKLNCLAWKADLNKSQRKEILDELKRLVAGSVVYFREAVSPNNVPGVAYLTPREFYWYIGSLWVTGEVVYICKQEKGVSLFKTHDTNFIVPEIVVRTVSYQDYKDMLEKRCKQFIPTPRF